MDINAALARMRELHGKIDQAEIDNDVDALTELALQLSIVAEAIDGWLSKGGFLPDAWARKS